MVIDIKTEHCHVVITDSDASEPATSRWSDQNDNIIKLFETAMREIAALHKMEIEG